MAAEQSNPMSLGQRAMVTVVAAVLAVPAGCGAGVFLLDRGIGGDSVHTDLVHPLIVLLAIGVLGTAFVFEVGSRLTNRRSDGHRMAAVATCTVFGLLSGLYFVDGAPLEAAGLLALLGGFVGTFIGSSLGAKGGRGVDVSQAALVGASESDPPSDEDPLVPIAGFATVVESEACRSALLSAGFRVTGADQFLLQMDPALGPALGGFSLAVPASEADDARSFLAAAEGGELSAGLAACSACGSTDVISERTVSRSGTFMNTLLLVQLFRM